MFELNLKMLGFGESFLLWLVATTIPALVGLIAIVGLGTRARPVYSAAFGLGVFLWFFLDTIGGSAGLDVSSSFGGGVTQVSVVGLFIVGVVLLFWVDSDRAIFNVDLAANKYGLAIPLLVAAAVGIHGLGEGSAAGTLAATTSSTDLINAVGGVNAGIAYVLHKAIEPMMVGACYLVYSKGANTTLLSKMRNLLLLTIVFVIPSLLGNIVGYFVAFDTSYFYALGTGTSIYAAIRLAAPLFSPVQNPDSKDTIKLTVALLLGFLSIYVAALFHA